MATSYTWGYTNTTVSEAEVNPTKVLMKTNYSIIRDNAGNVLYDNKTAGIDLGEKVSLTYRPIKEVNSLNDVANPGKVSKGYEFKVRIDAVQRATYDNGTIVDSPQTMEFSVRGVNDGISRAASVEEQFKRLLGVLYDETSSTWRFNDLMRNALQISED